jgi:hypothetical protein
VVGPSRWKRRLGSVALEASPWKRRSIRRATVERPSVANLTFKSPGTGRPTPRLSPRLSPRLAAPAASGAAPTGMRGSPPCAGDGVHWRRTAARQLDAGRAARMARSLRSVGSSQQHQEGRRAAAAQATRAHSLTGRGARRTV